MLDFNNRELFDEKGSMIGYHTNDNLDSFNANINILVGQRANGKSYATYTFNCIKRFLDTGYKDCFAYVRRFKDELSGVASDVFNGPIDTGWLEWYTSGEWNNIYYWQRHWYLRRLNDDGEVEDKSKIMAYAFDVNGAGKAKGPDRPSIKTMFFDEFIPDDHIYAHREIQKWNALISNIDRNRNQTKIYMVANTISKECPYFEFYGIDPDELEKGKIYVGKAGTIGVLALEYCNDEGDPNTTESVYFNVKDEVGQMILSGDWQNRRFPSLPKDIDLKERTNFSFYVLLRDKLIRGSFLSLGDTSTIYFERADDYKLNMNELLFIDDQYLDSMRFKNIIVTFDPSNNIARTVLKYLKQGHCYYDSDDTGEKIAHFASL